MHDTHGEILIIEDDPVGIHSLSHILRDNYLLKIADTGREALRIATGDTPPDLILLDINLPDIDGYEVCKQLTQNPQSQNIPILFVSGRTGEEDQVHGFDLGAVDYITKPINAALLRSRVRSHINLKNRTQALNELAKTDPLTGVANTRQYSIALDAAWKRAALFSKKLALIILDIDGFRFYNQKRGHLEGDEYLRHVAQEMQKHCQDSQHVVCRLGGDEFAAIITDVPCTELELKIKAIIAALVDCSSQSEISPSVSIGASIISPDNTEAPSQLMQSAYEALYRVKTMDNTQFVINDC